MKGDLDGAMEDCSTNLGSDPSDPKALICRGRIRLDQGDLEGALEDLDASVRADEENALARHALGLVHARRHDHSLAVDEFDAAERLGFEPTGLLRDRATSKLELLRLEGALEDADRLLERMPGRSDGLLLRSNIHRAMGDQAAARRDLEAAAHGR